MNPLAPRDRCLTHGDPKPGVACVRCITLLRLHGEATADEPAPSEAAPETELRIPAAELAQRSRRLVRCRACRQLVRTRLEPGEEFACPGCRSRHVIAKADVEQEFAAPEPSAPPPPPPVPVAPTPPVVVPVAPAPSPPPIVYPIPSPVVAPLASPPQRPAVHPIEVRRPTRGRRKSGAVPRVVHHHYGGGSGGVFWKVLVVLLILASAAGGIGYAAWSGVFRKQSIVGEYDLRTITWTPSPGRVVLIPGVGEISHEVTLGPPDVSGRATFTAGGTFEILLRGPKAPAGGVQATATYDVTGRDTSLELRNTVLWFETREVARYWVDGRDRVVIRFGTTNGDTMLDLVRAR